MKIKKNLLYFLLAFICMFLVIWLPFLKGSGLSIEGRKALGLLIFIIILWITEAIPFPTTGLIVILLIPIFGLTSFKDAIYSGFGNSIIIFFIGVMIISAALNKSGILYRLTLIALNKVGLESSKLIFTFMGIAALLSMWITNMAVAAILLPVAREILEKAKIKPLKSNFGKSLMISIAWGCGIGGVGTPVGNGGNILAVGFLGEMAGINITFISWMKIGVPVILILLLIGWFILTRIFPAEIDALVFKKNYIKDELKALGPLTSKEGKALTIFGLAIFLWLTNPFINPYLNFPISNSFIALFAAILIFLPYIEILDWNDAQKDISWGSIILIAGGLSLGKVLLDSGTIKWIAYSFLTNIGNMNVIFQVLVIVTLIQIAKIFFSSNTASALILIPILITLAQGLKLDVWLVVGPAAFAASLACILVTSTPVNVIPYSAGYFSMKDFSISGILFTLAIIPTITFVFLFLN